jgi:hypothetical protein
MHISDIIYSKWYKGYNLNSPVINVIMDIFRPFNAAIQVDIMCYNGRTFVNVINVIIVL